MGWGSGGKVYVPTNCRHRHNRQPSSSELSSTSGARCSVSLMIASLVRIFTDSPIKIPQSLGRHQLDIQVLEPVDEVRPEAPRRCRNFKAAYAGCELPKGYPKLHFRQAEADARMLAGPKSDLRDIAARDVK